MQTLVEVDIPVQASGPRIFNHPKAIRVLQCLFSRITCISCLVVATFLICLTQEFTYILNYHSYTTTETWADKGLSPMLSDSPNSRKIHPDALYPYTRKHQITGIVNHAINDLHAITHNTSKVSSITSYSDTLNPWIQRQFTVKVANLSDDWRWITDNIFGYSAYWDNRIENKSLVRIIVGLKVPNIELNNLKCLLSSNSSSEVYIEVTSTHDFLIEHHGKSSRAAFIMCPTPEENPPSFVALVHYMWNSSWKPDPIWFAVHRLDNNAMKIGLGVCVRPMFNYTDTFRIVEFVAYYEALGANHFTFYNYDTLSEVGRLVKHLKSSNYSIDWFQWNLPPDIEDMWAIGQIANINDCIYRNMGSASYVAVVDLDEFITPRQVMTIQELMSIHDVFWKNLGSFVIRSCVFCSEFEQDWLPNVFPDFVTQTYIQRENKIWPYHKRSKYIVKPGLVISAGIHYVKEHTPPAVEYLMRASQAVVHHYRAKLCGDKGRDIKKGDIDPTSRKYLSHLLKSRALQTWEEFIKG